MTWVYWSNSCCSERVVWGGGGKGRGGGGVGGGEGEEEEEDDLLLWGQWMPAHCCIINEKGLD